MKRTTIIIAAMIACGLSASAFGADEDRPRKKRELAPATQPGDVGDVDRPFDQRNRRFKGGPSHYGGYGGRPSDHERFGRRPGPHGEFDPKQMEEFMEFAREEFPLLYERMKKAREKQPHGWGQKVAGPFGQQMMHMMQLRRENPELARKVIAQHRNEMKIGDLHRQYRDARTDEEKSAIAAEIRTLLEAGFELRLERLKLEIAQLEKRLNEARESLADQEQNKSSMIDTHLQKLLNSDVPPPPPPP